MKEEERNLPQTITFLNFFSLFPQIVAGPIERKKNLLPQLNSFTYSVAGERLSSAFPLVILGLFFKLVIADNIAFFIHQSDTQNVYIIWLSMLLYGLRIYFDFAGYSLISVGLGKLFGINLTYNF